MTKRIAILIAVGGLTFWPAPAGAATAVECRKACRQVMQACVDACGEVDLHGLSVRQCKAVCRQPRVRSTCVRFCRTTGIGS